MKKRYLLAVVGLESDQVVPLSFHGFWRRRAAEAKVARLNARRGQDHMTRFAVYDRRSGGLLNR